MYNYEEGMYIITNEFFDNHEWKNRIAICSDVRNRNSMFPLQIKFVDGRITSDRRSEIPIRFREVNIAQTFLLNKLLL